MSGRWPSEWGGVRGGQAPGRGLTVVGDHLLGGAGLQVGDLEDGVTVRLHGRPGNGAQPIVSRVVQLGKIVS